MDIDNTQPIGSFVMLENVQGPEEHYESGLYIPQIATKNSEVLKVIDFGTGEEGIEFNVKLGDYVLVDKRDAIVMKIGNRKVIQAKTSDIIATFDDPSDHESITPLEPYLIMEPLQPRARIEGGLIVPAPTDETIKYMVYAMSEEDECDEYEEGDIVYIVKGLEFDLGMKTFVACKHEDIIGRVDYD